MTFDKLSPLAQVEILKQEFTNIIRSLFEHPEFIEGFVKNKKLTLDEGMAFLKAINSLNKNPCVCCRSFDGSKLSFTPINDCFLPLLEVARDQIKNRIY